jgi:phosphatidylglycerol---prolipoprotein diacylglyceryl transferase
MINPVAFSVFGHDIRWYGIIIAIGLLLAILLAKHHAKREGHDPDSIIDLALVVVPMAVVFARIYYVVFRWNEVYANQPFWHVFAVWEGGLAIYGGVIGGFIGALIYSKFINKNKIGLYNLLDIAAPSLILGQAIGRWGNFVNQEAYGAAVTNPAWQWFPAAVKIANPQNVGEQPGWFMATFFYESMWNFLVFAFLYFYFKNSKKRKPGNVFWFYLLLYGIGRCVIEGLREDSLYLGSFRVSQMLSVLLVVAAAAVLLLRYIKMRRDEIATLPLDESLKLRVDISDDEPEDEPENEPSSEPKAEESEPMPDEGESEPDKHRLTVDETIANLVEEETTPEEPNKEG